MIINKNSLIVLKAKHRKPDDNIMRQKSPQLAQREPKVAKHCTKSDFCTIAQIYQKEIFILMIGDMKTSHHS